MSKFVPICLDYKSEIENGKMLVDDLAAVLRKIGVTVTISKPENENGKAWLTFDYDIENVEQKFSRGAGKKERYLNVTPEEVRNRMKAGESAEAIAKDLGISRATLFRRLKNAEENYFDEL